MTENTKALQREGIGQHKLVSTEAELDKVTSQILTEGGEIAHKIAGHSLLTEVNGPAYVLAKTGKALDQAFYLRDVGNGGEGAVLRDILLEIGATTLFLIIGLDTDGDVRPDREAYAPEVIAEFRGELVRAERKFPWWPDDVVNGTSILGEEAGEALRAALQLQYEAGTKDDLRAELVQVGAMAVRMILDIDTRKLA